MRRWAGILVVGLLVSVGAQAGAQVGSSISGTVTAEGGGPLADICVYAYGSLFGAFGETDSDGSYTLNVAPGSYRVEFWDCAEQPIYVAEFYDDEPSFEEADQVQVGPAEAVEGIDAALAVGGSISGVVTNEQGDGLGGICVEAAGDGPPWAYSYTETDASGSYSVGGLPTGDYRVYFFDCNYPQEYRGELYDDKTDWWDADLVGVTVGVETPGVDAVLAELSSLTLADLAVTALGVENVPLRTDQGEVGYTGMSRRISVEGANLSQTQQGEGWLEIRVCPSTVGLCRVIHGEYLSLGPDETFEQSVAWNGAGTVGDVTISAEIWMFDDDADWDNNYRQIDHYVIVGGSGVGVGASLLP